jgi:hypothetical protein
LEIAWNCAGYSQHIRGNKSLSGSGVLEKTGFHNLILPFGKLFWKPMNKKEITMSNEQKEPESNKPNTQSMGFWIAIGVGVGAGIGVAMHNIAVGVGVGIALGVAIGAVQMQRNKNK